METSKPLVPLNEHTWAQASEWLLRFSEEDADAGACEQFNAWLRMSPENVHAYLQVSAFWQSADQLGRSHDGSRDINALVARAKAEGNVLPLALGPHSTPERAADPAVIQGKASVDPKRYFWFAAAALLLSVGVGAATWYTQFRDPTYSTGIGEQRTINLPDGSRVILNADSRLEVHFSDRERGIELSAGQALFTVEKDVERPFVVRGGDTRVRAVGTQFDVYMKKTGTVVTVVEGRVAVSSRASHDQSDLRAASDAQMRGGAVFLSAGQQVTMAIARTRIARSIEASAPPPHVIQPVKLEVATAWTDGLLVFDAAPIAEVVQEFNRQNAKPLVLEGQGLEAVKITGTFPARGLERITRFLQERYGVVVVETDDEIRISKR
jgi:transmembrane sensor